MIEHLTHRRDLYIILFTWMIVGMFNSLAGMAVITVSLLAFWRIDYYFGLLTGFIFVLVLSDNLESNFAFAKTYKNIYIIFLFLTVAFNSQYFKPFNTFHVGFIPFLLVAVFGLLYAGNVGTSAMKTLSYALLLITVPNYVVKQYREEGYLFLKDIAYFLLTISYVGLIIGMYNTEASYLEGRFRGIFGNPNGQGLFLYLTFGYFYVVSQLFPDAFDKKEKWFFYISLIFFLYLCGSRTAFLSIFILLFFNWVSFLSPYIAFLLLLVFVLWLDSLFGIFVEMIRNFGLENYFRLRTLEDGSGRFLAWKFAWDKIQDFFFFGGSMGNDEYIMRQNYRELAMLGHQGGVHNSYLTLWFDVGLVGLLFYFFNFLRIFFRSAVKHVVAMPVLYSVLFCITYESWLAGSLNPFTIILFIIMTVLVTDEFTQAPTEVSDKYEVEKV